ncbi:MAG TPA: GlsB/YeaQ/YmgE family stress response membrane protein [Chloroflexota bacterium]
MVDFVAVTYVIPAGLFGWILVGLIAGAVAGRIARGRGYGCIGDIVVGLIGSVVGGWIYDALFGGGRVLHFWTSVVVAILGAVVLIFALRLVRTAL